MRNLKRKLTVILIMAFIFSLASVGYSQSFDPSMHGRGKGGKGGMGGPGMGMRGGFHEKNLENLRLLKMLELLELDEEQTGQFIAIFSQFRQDMKRLHDSAQVEVEVLANLLNMEEIDEGKVLTSVAKIQNTREQRMERMKELQKKSQAILTVKQLGKLVIFEERFDRELLESLQGFRGRGGPDTTGFKR